MFAMTKPQLVAQSRMLSGRRARWRQIGLIDNPLLYSVLFDVVEFLREGFPREVIQTIWELQPRHGQDYCMAKALLKNDSFIAPPSISHFNALRSLAQEVVRHSEDLLSLPHRLRGPPCASFPGCAPVSPMVWGQWNQGRGNGSYGGGRGGGHGGGRNFPYNGNNNFQNNTWQPWGQGQHGNNFQNNFGNSQWGQQLPPSGPFGHVISSITGAMNEAQALGQVAQFGQLLSTATGSATTGTSATTGLNAAVAGTPAAANGTTAPKSEVALLQQMAEVLKLSTANPSATPSTASATDSNEKQLLMLKELHDSLKAKSTTQAVVPPSTTASTSTAASAAPAATNPALDEASVKLSLIHI